MTVLTLQELLDLRADVVPLTVEQYHQMIEAGILLEGEPIELLDGFLVRKDRSRAGDDPMTVGHHHAWAVQQLNDVLQGAKQHECHVRVQQPLSIPPDHEPEPDALVVRGPIGRYKERHPLPRDVLCVIEVADSSLQRDRTTKLRIYADAGIPQYVIVNLLDGVIEEHRGPVVGEGRYTTPRMYRKGETIGFDAGEGRSVSVAAAELLP